MRKKIMRIALFLGVLFTAAGCQKEGDEPVTGTVTDPDGQEYRWRKMNDGKIWMAENLNYDIRGYTWWWYDNDPVNGELYGRLYDWQAAKAACPVLGDNWELPTDEDWINLANIYGGYYEYEKEEEVGNATISYQALWKDGSSGFSALPGGYRYVWGDFNDLGNYGGYWSDTEHGDGWVRAYSFTRVSERLGRDIIPKAVGFSCRCVRHE
jgi:uncharacterized protein (TIGR02145 family)